jgi:hypothetical protein
VRAISLSAGLPSRSMGPQVFAERGLLPTASGLWAATCIRAPARISSADRIWTSAWAWTGVSTAARTWQTATDAVALFGSTPAFSAVPQRPSASRFFLDCTAAPSRDCLGSKLLTRSAGRPLFLVQKIIFVSLLIV